MEVINGSTELFVIHLAGADWPQRGAVTHSISMLLISSHRTKICLQLFGDESIFRFSDHLRKHSIKIPQRFGLSLESPSPIVQRHFSRAMASGTKQQPPWQPPPPAGPNARLPPLKIWNSLTRSKTPFVPIDWQNNVVTWYACGPTVYDDAHLGHARNYVSTDIIRRIMRDYFKFNVKFVMNITDVDDKVSG